MQLQRSAKNRKILQSSAPSYLTQFQSVTVRELQLCIEQTRDVFEDHTFEAKANCPQLFVFGVSSRSRTVHEDASLQQSMDK